MGGLTRILCAAPAALLLCACMDNTYYVKTDGSPDVLVGVAHMQPPKAPPAPLDLGVTFKSDGVIVPTAADTLYRSVRQGVAARGRWEVRRLGRSSDDFAPVIRAIITARAGTQPGQAAGAIPRLLVLVENAPDLSSGTQVHYFLSGMSFGVYSLHRPTDRYDVTVAYRDPNGVERIYRSHQDLMFTTGSKLTGRDETGLAGLKHYDTPQAAFDGIVDNSVNGTRRGTVTAGQPRFDTPHAAAPAPGSASAAPGVSAKR